MKNRKILLLDLIFVFGTLAIIIGVYSYLNLGGIRFSPLETLDKTFVLKNFGLDVQSILISDSFDFKNYEEVFVEDGARINLDKGIYYLKFKGEISEIGKFEVQVDEVIFEVRRFSDGNYGLINAGPENYEVYMNKPNDGLQNIVNFVGGENE